MRNRIDKNKVKVTPRDYYRYHLFEREDVWNPFHHGKRLTEQWITNQWAKIQQVELNQMKSRKMQKV